MNLIVKWPDQPKQRLDPVVLNLMDCFMMLQKQLINLLDGMLDTNNVREISASKITAGTIEALIEIISPLITGGTITGGTIKTADTGKRVEISENQIKCYNADNQLNGFVIDNTDAQYGDASFYYNGTKVFKIYNSLDGNYSILPESGTNLAIGSSDGTITLRGVTSESLVEQSTAPDAEASKIKLYFDGTDLKTRLPDGTIKTITMT